MTIDELIKRTEALRTGCDTEWNPYLDGVIEVLKQADRLRWHDLQKDPTDLPPCKTGWFTACVLIKYDGKPLTRSASWEDGRFYIYNAYMGKVDVEVIAWRRKNDFEREWEEFD